MAKRIAVFASGNGSNFQVIAEQFPVEFVFSDHRDAYVLERAKNLGVASYAFELKEFDNKAAYEEAIVKLLEEHQIDLVCLAGYMKIVGPTLILSKLASTKQSTSSIQKSWIVWEWRENEEALEMKDNFRL